MSIDEYNKFKQGFTLIEVLISMVIVAVGLLGLAAMQLTGLQNNQRSFLRTQATLLAYDMSDRMRANPAGVASGSYNNQPGVLKDCVANTCTSVEMAEDDIFQWNLALSTPLGIPLGVGVICIDNSPDDGSVLAGVITPACNNPGGTGTTYAIKVWWDDAKTGNADQRFVMSFEP